MTARQHYEFSHAFADDRKTERPGPIRLLLIRHADPVGGAEHRLAGRMDVDLSPLGRRQARELGAYLAALPLAAIYSSPLKRARKTALAIARTCPTARMALCDDLREVDLGVVEGLTAWEAWRRWPALFDKALDPATKDFAFPDGEAWSAAEGRAERALAGIARAHEPEDTVAVVTHGAILGLLLARFSGETRGAWRRYQPRHGSVSTVMAEVGADSPWLFPARLDVSDFWTRRLRTAVALRKAARPGTAPNHRTGSWHARPDSFPSR